MPGVQQFSGVSGLSGQVSSNTSAINTVSGQTATNTTAISDLTARTTAGETALASLTARVLALETATTGHLVGTTGQATIATNISIAGQVDVTVPFTRTMANTTYGAYVSIEGAASLLGAFVALIKTKSTTNCVVTVKNTALVSLGSGAVVRVAAIN